MPVAWKGAASLTQEDSPELSANLAYFKTAGAVLEYSSYQLFPEEEYFFSKYYKAGESVLDLACGMGRTTLLLHERGLAVRGVDRSEVFYRGCQAAVSLPRLAHRQL
jgi:cyclopropane fatty-acyl-phospholipid synthase-like methyltransferase